MNRRLRLLIWSSSGAAALALMFGATFVAGAFLSPRADQVMGINDTGLSVPQFLLVDQRNRTISNSTLRGRAWVAGFFFSRCSDSCPMLSRKVKTLQETLDSRVLLVSFTMDPAHDTPTVLKEYSERLGADSDRWHFLTGDRDVITNVAAALRPDGRTMAAENLSHTEWLILIDPTGVPRGSYDASKPADLDRLQKDGAAMASPDPALRPSH